MVSYYKRCYHVNETFTRYLEEAIELFDKFIKGKPTEPIIEIIKIHETDED